MVVDQVTPEDDAAIVSWFGDPDQPKVLHDAKGPMLALAARGWPLAGLARDTALSAYLARPDQRSYDLADLTVRYLKRELKQSASDDGQLSLDGLDDALSDGGGSETAMLHASAVLDLAAALDDGARRPRRHRSAGRRRAAADRRAGGHGAGRHRRRPRPAQRARGGVRHPGPRRRGGGVRRGRQGGQPRFAQAAPGHPLRRARHAEDQAHQDRLHDRRRRAAGPLREDRSTRSSSISSSTATPSGCARRSRVS